MLIRRLWNLLGDVDHAAVPVRLTDPLKAQPPGDRLPFDTADQHDELVDVPARLANEVGVTEMVGKELPENQASHDRRGIAKDYEPGTNR